MPGCNLLTFVLSVTIVKELSLVVYGECKSPIGGELKQNDKEAWVLSNKVFISENIQEQWNVKVKECIALRVCSNDYI